MTIEFEVKKYYCSNCNEELIFNSFRLLSENEEEKNRPLFCEKCKEYFGWKEENFLEAVDYLKQRYNLDKYGKDNPCEMCLATGNVKPFENIYEECPNCKGLGVLLISKEDYEKGKLENRKNRNKGLNFNRKDIKEKMRRMKTKSFRINNNEITYILEDSVKKQKNVEFILKKKKDKLAKKNRKNNRKN